MDAHDLDILGKRMPTEDMISREEAIDVMLMAIDDDWEPDYATDRMNELPSAQPEQLGMNLAEVGTEPTNIVKNCNDKSSGSDDYSYKSAGGGTEQKYDPFLWNDNTDGLIDRAHLLKRLQDFVEWCKDDRLDGTKFCIDVIKDEPSAQPGIIRCKDCKCYLSPHGCGHIDGLVTSQEDGFCSYAERRTK